METIACDRTRAAHAETRTRERLAVDHLIRQAERGTDHADLVLVEKLDRLDELHLHLFRQAANVVVGLDAVLALKDVRINGALAEEMNILKLRSLLVEDLDELAADDLSLLLRIGDTCEKVKETVGSVDIDEVGAELLLEDVDDHLALALAHEAVVDMDAGELLADSLDEERRDDRGVDAAGERKEHLAVADLLP